MPAKLPALDVDDIIQQQSINQISTDLISAKSIAVATRKDCQLSKLLQQLQNAEVQDEKYSLQDGVIFKGHRVYIPPALQQAVLDELHSTHIKTSKMKSLARRYCFWTNIYRDIEAFVKSCKACASTTCAPPSAPIHPWEEPTSNVQRVRIDYAGPKDGHYIFILIDVKSKWPEVRISKSPPTSASTIEYLQDIFSVNGLPEVMVSDNASIFTNSEFIEFCESNGIRRRLIAPGHPQTNGQVERYVQFLKRKLDAMESIPGSLQSKIRNILFHYRGTPLRCEETPAELYLGRQIRTKLDLLKPYKATTKKATPVSKSCLRSFSVGDRAIVKMYTGGKEIWKPGIIIEKYGRLH
nr:uncharacterized protein K02A2.6-like [Halyomorpha halys]